MKKRSYKITVTHNPQDFFNGTEPPELHSTYETDELETDVNYELAGGYTVIVTRSEGDSV